LHRSEPDWRYRSRRFAIQLHCLAMHPKIPN